VLREIGQRGIRHRQERLKAGVLRLLLLLLLLLRLLLRGRSGRQYWLRDHVLVQMVSRACQQAACHAGRERETAERAGFLQCARFAGGARAANRAESASASFASRQRCVGAREQRVHAASFAASANFSRQFLPSYLRVGCSETRNLSSILSKCQSICSITAPSA